MKTSRLELRLDTPLRQKLDALAELSGRSASETVRRLILAAHKGAFGDPRPSPGTTPPAPVRQTALKSVSALVSEPDDPGGWMSTDAILALAGVDLGPGPEPDLAEAGSVTRPSTEMGL